MNNKTYEGKEGFVKVVFSTGTKTNQVAPSPTRAIRGSYHFGADGDVIWVHVDDQKARPQLYKLVKNKRKRRIKKEAN